MEAQAQAGAPPPGVSVQLRNLRKTFAGTRSCSCKYCCFCTCTSTAPFHAVKVSRARPPWLVPSLVCLLSSVSVGLPPPPVSPRVLTSAPWLRVLQGVSFTIEENKLFCLLGPNGEQSLAQESHARVVP